MKNQLTLLKEGLSLFWNRHGEFTIMLSIMVGLMFIVPHAFAGTTGGDLTQVEKHVQTETTGDVVNILAWVMLALGFIGMVTSMSLKIVVTMFGIFIALIVGPSVISSHFSALI